MLKTNTEAAVSLISREEFLLAARHTDVALSRNGQKVAFSAIHDGTANVWIAPIETPQSARQITSLTGSGIGEFHWTYTNKHMLVTHDEAGHEHWQMYCLDVRSGEMVRLSPDQNAETRLVSLSREDPEHIMVSSNARNPRYFDIYKINILTGNAELIVENNQFTWIYADQYLNPRLGEFRTENGGILYKVRTDSGDWAPLFEVSADDETFTRPFRMFESRQTFGPGAREVYAMDSRNRDASALCAWDLESGTSRLIGETGRTDVSGILLDPLSLEVMAYGSYDEKMVAKFIDPDASRDFAFLKDEIGEDISIRDQSDDKSIWAVQHERPDSLRRIYLFNRETRLITPVGANEKSTLTGKLAITTPFHIASRDGLDLVSYVTVPAGVPVKANGLPTKPQPTIVMVHGGPWVRDYFDFDPWVQFLANRGYAILTVNYRGSRGFGKTFLNLGNKEWGGKMFEDVIDGTIWACDEGLADPAKIAVMGASFGGFMTLTCMTRRSDLFACGVDIFGPSNLETFLEDLSPYWQEFKFMWDTRLGTIETQAGRDALKKQSPITYVSQLKSPLLIIQGANDPRVRKNESDQIVAALKETGTPVCYMEYPDEGHSLAKAPNLLSAWAGIESFLAEYLGGRCEPYEDDLSQSSLKVSTGADLIPSLRDQFTE